jgi:hypothetical protein
MKRITIPSGITITLLVLVLSSLFYVGITSSASVYDPYADYDADGDVDIFDVVPVASVYGTSGDPARNVTVTNWPLVVTPETTVWFGNSSFPLTSQNYSGAGYSNLHLFLHVLYAGPGSAIELRVKGMFHDTDSPLTRSATAYSVIMTEDPRREVLSVTIPVPSATFYFEAHLLSGGGTVFLSFYLTNA